MHKRLLLIFFVILILIFTGCSELNDDTINNIWDGINNNLLGPTIEELVELEKQQDYSYSVQSISCDDSDCDPPSNSTMKISNSLNLTLGISYREGYNSYYLTDYNEMTVRQWAPGYTIMGSEVECSGFSIADTTRKTLVDLNAQILGREKMYVDGEYVNCTHTIYYTYQKDNFGNDTEDISLIYENWIWDENGVKVKSHIYRPDEIYYLSDFDMTQTMYNFVFGGLTELDFAYPDPCNIID